MSRCRLSIGVRGGPSPSANPQVDTASEQPRSRRVRLVPAWFVSAPLANDPGELALP